MLNQITERLGHYASLKNAEDSSNNDHLSRQAELTNLLTKFGSLIVEGQELELSQSSYFSFLNNKDRDLRRKAFHQFYAEFDDHKYSLASALSSSVRANVSHFA